MLQSNFIIQSFVLYCCCVVLRRCFSCFLSHLRCISLKALKKRILSIDRVSLCFKSFGPNEFLVFLSNSSQMARKWRARSPHSTATSNLRGAQLTPQMAPCGIQMPQWHPTRARNSILEHTQMKKLHPTSLPHLATQVKPKLSS